MPRSLTRRRFLRDSAIVSGGAVLLVGLDRTDADAASPSSARRPDAARHRSDGLSAQMERGGQDDEVLVRWTHADSSSLELTPTLVRFDVPTFGVAEVDIGDFERGASQHEIGKFFGVGALDQLRNEVFAMQLASA